MKIEKKINIAASVDQVWDLVGGTQFGQLDQWASDVHQSSGSVLKQGRVCNTSMGPFKERITHIDEIGRTLSYQATGEKMPFFLKRLENNWHVKRGMIASQSEVHMRMEADLMIPFSWLMGPMMKSQFAKVAQNVLDELKHYAERNQPHPRKVEAARNARERGLVAA